MIYMTGSTRVMLKKKNLWEKTRIGKSVERVRFVILMPKNKSKKRDMRSHGRKNRKVKEKNVGALEMRPKRTLFGQILTWASIEYQLRKVSSVDLF